MPRKRYLWLALPLLCILIASWSFSVALKAGWLRRSLSARLAASFGRPVEAAHFGFTVWGGPKFEADSVTVSEDPRFGQEYFLRADRLTARLRWTALLRGRMEFAELALDRPSLNLVRSADGQWNVETWLPPAKTQPSVQSYRSPVGQAPNASQIDIQGGRINFKNGLEKLTFALVNLSGRLNLQSAGRWSLDLSAEPMRVAVVLQRSGTLRLRGTIGGTSARLQPADLRLSWEGASLADAARLARGTDYGLRGTLDADFGAHVSPADTGETGSPWRIEGGFRLQAIHGWDLVGRSDNPAMNIMVQAVLHPVESRLEVEHWLVETPHSNLGGEASVDWSRGFDPEVHLVDSRIGFPDLLNWAHAFFPGRAQDLEIGGNAEIKGKFSGWPLRIQDFTVSSDGASIQSDNGAIAPIRTGAMEASWSHSSLIFAPIAVRLSSPVLSRDRRSIQSQAPYAALFRIDGMLGPIHAGDALRDWPYRVAVSGQTERLQDLRALIAAAGWQLGTNWNAEGSASLQLACSGELRHGSSLVHGQIELRNLRLTNGSIAEPIFASAASIEFSPGERRLKIAGLEALGAFWKGAFEQSIPNSAWSFDLAASRLDFGELGQLLAQGRESLFYRLLPFAQPSGLAPETAAAIARINAQGHLHVDDLALGTSVLENVDAMADLAHGNLTLRRAEADLYGGRLTGEFRAQLGADVSYRFRGQVDRTDLSALASLSSIKEGFSGIGSGEIALSARGLGRQALLASLEGEGFLQVRDAAINLLNLPVLPSDTSFRDMAAGRFRSSTVSFRIENGEIRVDPWLLSERQRQLEIVGNIDFSRRIELRVRALNQPDRASQVSDLPADDDIWVLGGTLDTPQIIREERASAGNESIARSGRH